MQTLLLHIETATKVCSVALSEGLNVLSLRESNDINYSHAEKINGFIEKVMTESDRTFSQLDGIVVSKGPGSYTGLRIGVSTAKGLAYALNIPILAVDTLEAMAFGYRTKYEQASHDHLLPMIDARREEVYTAVYDHKGRCIQPTQALVIDDDQIKSWQNYFPIRAFGDGADKFGSRFNQGSNVQFSTGFLPSAHYMVSLGLERFNRKEFEDLAYFEPYYLKEFIAIKPKRIF